MKPRAGHKFCEVCGTSIRPTLWEAHIKTEFHISRIPKEATENAPIPAAEVPDSSSDEEDFSQQHLVPVALPTGTGFHVSDVKVPLTETPDSEDNLMSEFQAEIDLLEEPTMAAIPTERRSELADLIAEGVASKKAKVHDTRPEDEVSDEDDWRTGRIS